MAWHSAVKHNIQKTQTRQENTTQTGFSSTSVEQQTLARLELGRFSSTKKKSPVHTPTNKPFYLGEFFVSDLANAVHSMCTQPTKTLTGIIPANGKLIFNWQRV